MESTGEAGRIQLSKSMADLLYATQSCDIAACIEERPGLIECKGKGQQKTFWLNNRKSVRAPEQPTRRRSSSIKEISTSILNQLHASILQNNGNGIISDGDDAEDVSYASSSRDEAVIDVV